MTKLKAILFDYDGTLRDTRQLIYEALDHAFVSHDLPSPSSQQLAPYIHHHTHVHRQFASSVTPEKFEAAYRDKVDELMPAIQLYSDASEVLKQLHDMGYKLALVTAASRVLEDVQRLSIADYFDTIVGANDISNHKPDPEGTLLALRRLGVKPDEAILVGDLATDLQAAQAAGLRATVAITHGFGSRESFKQVKADYIIDSLDELVTTVEAIDQ